jgi:hypothetical protein
MRIPGGGEIGEETHADVDQILVSTAGGSLADGPHLEQFELGRSAQQ